MHKSASQSTHVGVLCSLQTGAILIPFFQQFSGINTIMFYATELFDVLGDGANSALLDTAIVGAVNVGSTILAIVLVDRYLAMLLPVFEFLHICALSVWLAGCLCLSV